MGRTDRPFKIDGVSIPTPTSYEPGIEDLSSEETGRTLDGVMHKDVVADKAYYNCEWRRLSWADAATLLNAINKKRKVAFTHADPRVPNQWITKDFYVGARSLGALDLSDRKRSWVNIRLQFTEI